MFDFIRTHQRLMQFILLLLILPSFVFFGIQGYSSFTGNENAVAKIAGQPITEQELEVAQRQRMDRYRQMLGERFDPKMFETPEQRRALVDELIMGRVVAAEANRHNLTATDAHVNQTLGELPEVKALFGPDGKLDMARYQELLTANRTTHEALRARVRDDVVRRQVATALVSSALVPKTVVERIAQLTAQEREVQELAFPVLQYLTQVKISPEEIKKYYDAHADEFRVPEQVTAEYVVLDQDALGAAATVSEEDVKNFYEQNKSRYELKKEERRASHILIKAGKEAKPADREAAKAKAQQLLAQARKNPDDFAKLAKEHSQDEGSAASGGDLDYFGRGMTVPAFEKAAFALKEGEIGDVVESDYGYHIIKLTGIKPGELKPLADVRAEIEKELRRQYGAKRFAEVAENFVNTVYEQSDSLKPIADKLQLKVQRTEGVARVLQPGQDPKQPIFHEKVREALFTDDVLKNKRNTEAVDVGNNTLVAARVVARTPAKQRPLEEVSEGIKAFLTQQKANELAVKAGQEKLAALQKTPSEAEFGAAKTVSRINPAGLSPEAITAVMKADTSKLPALVGVELGRRGYAIYRISKVVNPPPGDATEQAARKEPLVRAEAEAEANAYLEALKKRYKVEVLQAAQKAGGEAGGEPVSK